MRPSRNALIGYTYQEQITFLFLVMMDVERKFNSLEIEADVENNFDDIKIRNGEDSMYFQIKDYDEITLEDLQFNANEVSIKGKKHLLENDSTNVLVFKNIDITTNCKYCGLSALKLNNVYVISLSRLEADNMINKLYAVNGKRKIAIDRFFKNNLDKRILKINKDDLPIIKVFDTKLLEETINIGKKHLKFSNILHLEGKPGIGKSHYVSTLSKEYEINIVYRFWISEQDNEKNTRLQYINFLSDISKKVFHDYAYRNEAEIINEIEKTNRVVIIDGLDHVENYNNEDLEKFVQFINKLSLKCKTIILSRPLKYKTSWNKQVLTNWNEKETRKVLKELYHIDDYKIGSDIYNLTDGYPILVRFISEHYKAFKDIPSLKKLKDVEDYYNQILKNVNTRTALTLFLTSRSFFMKSELSLFLSGELLTLINEFIEAYPYLFEIRLNRVSLFHDSFNKYLRELNIDFSERKSKVHNLVYQSIIDGDKKFMSRFSYFDLESWMKVDIIKKYSSIILFQEIAKDCIDFEALRIFYIQIRESLNDISYSDLEILNYYDLSLILNIVERDHISTLNGFLYTYSQCLIFNGYSIEDITSSGYLFGMITHIIENDPILLYNITSDSFYDTTRFIENLEDEINDEVNFFIKHKKHINLSKPIDFYLKDDYRRREYLTNILTNLYIHNTSDKSLLELQYCIKSFIDFDENEGISFLQKIYNQKELKIDYPHWVLNDVKKNLLSLGIPPNNNPYLNLSLKDYILKNRSISSFDMSDNILSYLRLSLEKKTKIDISSIGLFWCMYYQRKDYSVVNIAVALKVFEENKLIDEETSIKRIISTQNMSEKGIRHLLTDYINLHAPSIVEKVVDNFEIEDLNISWFNLTPKHISDFPDGVFNYAVRKVFEFNHFQKEVDFKDISNVFYSSRWLNLLEKLKFFKFKIRIPINSKELKEIENCGITYVTYEEEDHKSNSSEYRHKHGMLDSRDINFITKNNLNDLEVSGYLDGNYSALSDLGIYKIYPKTDISKNMKIILFNAILGKVRSINMFGSLYYFIGNLPKLINDYSSDKNIDELYESFDTFMELSLLNQSGTTS
jgi:hypothetical protein